MASPYNIFFLVTHVSFITTIYVLVTRASLRVIDVSLHNFNSFELYQLYILWIYSFLCFHQWRCFSRGSTCFSTPICSSCSTTTYCLHQLHYSHTTNGYRLHWIYYLNKSSNIFSCFKCHSTIFACTWTYLRTLQMYIVHL